MRDPIDTTMSGIDTTMSGTRRTVVGVFSGSSSAEKALNDLRDAGFSPEQISVVARDRDDARTLAEGADLNPDAAAGVGTGAVLGGISGGVLGWLIGMGALVIPGIGPIVAAGVLATTLGGAAVGAAAGGLIGALVDLGIPEEEARGYETSVREGHILLTVQARGDDQASKARRIFDRYQGMSVNDYGAGTSVNY